MQRTKLSQYGIRVQNMYSAGLIAISLVLLQTFLGLSTLDVAAMISVLAFSFALPILGGVLVIESVESKYQHLSSHRRILKVVDLLWSSGVAFALVGVVAALWHITWIAGTLFLVSAVIAGIIFGWYIIELREDTEHI